MSAGEHAAEASAEVRRLELVPAGGLSVAVLQALGPELDRRFGTRWHAGDPLPLDPSWRCAAGKGYRSTAIVDALLHRLASCGADHARHWALAVTDRALCAPGARPVFGEATVGGCCAVVGTAALRGGRGAGGARLRRRLLAEAVHELGHVAGLEHCADPRCVMYPSRDIADTDRKGPDFCARCRRDPAGLLRRVSLDPARAWD